MAVAFGKDTTVDVSTDGGTTLIPVNKVFRISSREEQTDDEKIYTFNSATPETDAGEDEGTLDLSWMWDDADPGQEAVRAARDAGTAIFFQILWNGTKGFSRDFTVQSKNTDSDPNGTGTSKRVTEQLTLTSAGPSTPVP